MIHSYLSHKRFLILVVALVLALICLMASVPTAWAESHGSNDMMAMEESALTVTGWRVNVRNGPGIDYAIYTKLMGGDVLMAHGRNEDGTWLQISYPGGGPDRRWISAEWTSITEAQAGALPVVKAACEWVVTSGTIFAYESPSQTAKKKWIKGEYRAFGQRQAEGELWYKIYYRGGRRWVQIVDLDKPCGPLEEIPAETSNAM